MVSQPRKGQVYWLDLGEPQGSAPGGRRPCVVVQSDAFNRSGIGTTVVCSITSNLRLAAAPGNVELQAGEGGLPKASVINVSQVVTVDKRDLVERLGSLSAARQRQVNQGLLRVLSLDQP